MSVHRPTQLATLAIVGAVIGLSLVAMPAAAADKVIIVKAGDTLSEIALDQGVTVAALVKLNGLADARLIYPGQRLTVRREGGSGAGQAAAGTHRVSSGENLWVIAQHYGVTVAAIVAANHIAHPSYLRVGQRLTIPGATAAPDAAGTSFSRTMSSGMRQLVAARDAIRRIITREARSQGVPLAFALAVAWQESGWQHRVVSSAGAIGVMQLTPATAKWIGISLLGDPFDPSLATENIRGGVALLRHYLDRYHGDRPLVLAAYYQGQRAADLHGIYPVSRPYIASVLALQALFGG